MTANLEERRRKLRFRAWRRGFREMDLLMGSFADAHLADLSATELDAFERLLELPDWEVYAWLVGQAPVPDAYSSSVLDRLIGFRFQARPG